MKFRTPYQHDRAISALFATVNKEDSLTQQSDKNDSDINVIVGRFIKSGQLPLRQDTPMSGDFTGVFDYRSALDAVRRADAAFADVPAKIRKEFDNDPAKFLEFAEDSKNKDKMIEWGLLDKPKEPTRVEPQAPPPQPQSSAPVKAD